MSESLNEYIQNLNAALEKGDAYTNYNKDMVHAIVVVSLAFQHAERHIRILSHKLDATLYGHPTFLKALNDFIGKDGVKLDVLVEDGEKVGSDNPFVNLTRQVSDKATLKRLSDPKKAEAYNFNFMVIDGTGFRFEYDRNEEKAFVSFNDKDQKLVAEQLIEIFEQLFDEAVTF